MTRTGLRALSFPFLLLAMFLWACSGGGGDRSEVAGGTPPVLLITVDGLVADELSAFGGERKSPALDSLVSSATVWQDGWTAAPLTRPAVATYLTGLAPDRHRVINDISSRLPDGVPTLAGLLAEKGYATAAFPGSSLLGPSSGLLREFEIVDDPPPLPFGPCRYIPLSTGAETAADHFALWVKNVPAESPWFAWIHFSAPLLEQMDRLGESFFGAGETHLLRHLRERVSAAMPGQPEPEIAGAETIEAFDAALATLLEAIEARGESRQALVLLAPTMGDISGGENEPPGPGLSLEERAIRVPFVARFPSGTPAPRDAERPAWAPDLPATVAGLAGVALPPEAEGVSLLADPTEERVLFSWSWATRDQMGWLPLRAARFGIWKRSEGFEEGTGRLDGVEGMEDVEAASALAEALEARVQLAPERVNLQPLQDWFDANELTIDPLPAEGGPFGPAQARRDTAALVWNARYEFRDERYSLCPISWRGALETDPDNPAALIGLGHTLSMMGNPMAEGFLRKAVEWYPGDWDALHWLGHAIWADSWKNAEELLVAILPDRPDDPDLLFDLACARSLDGDLAASERYVRAALEAGLDDWNLIETVASLRNLRETPGFSELLREHGR